PQERVLSNVYRLVGVLDVTEGDRVDAILVATDQLLAGGNLAPASQAHQFTIRSFFHLLVLRGAPLPIPHDGSASTRQGPHTGMDASSPLLALVPASHGRCASGKVSEPPLDLPPIGLPHRLCSPCSSRRLPACPFAAAVLPLRM